MYLYSIKLSVYKTGTIHNLMHNPIKFTTPDQECSLAFRLLVSSFVVCQGCPSGTVSGCLCWPDGWGLGPRTVVQIPCLLCGACPRSSSFHFILVSCGAAFSFGISRPKKKRIHYPHFI